MAIRKPQRKSNRQLWIMLALIVVIIAIIALLPSGEQTAGLQKKMQETQKIQEDEFAGSTRVKVGDPAPDFTVEMFDGSRITLSELQGNVVLLNFWATWCPPCREELTHVQKEIIDRFADRPFLFLPISRGESREDVAAFREKTGYSFPMGLDPTQSIYKSYATNLIPRNFLIGPDGRIVTATIGFEKAEFEELIRTIQATLDKMAE